MIYETVRGLQDRKGVLLRSQIWSPGWLMMVEEETGTGNRGQLISRYKKKAGVSLPNVDKEQPTCHSPLI